jgi:ribosome-binding protein aMBF1 (putative translation factor)
MAWLRSNYLPDLLPKAVKDCLEELQGRYDQLLDMVEEMEASLAWQATRNQETVPDEIVGRLLSGENPIRVWREYRGLSLRSLAQQASMIPSVLSDMETGKSEGRLGVMRKIAGILDASTDELFRPMESEVAGSGIGS